MKLISTACLAIVGLAATMAPSFAMMPAPPADQPPPAHEVRDPACRPVKGRCQWYGMPGVHHGPVWLRQHGGEGYRHHRYHHHKS